LSPSQISGYDPIEASRIAFTAKLGDGVRVHDSAAAAIEDATVIILAVKPQVMTAAIQPLAESFKSGKTSSPLIVSIAAGVPIAKLEQLLPQGMRVIRVMPNTPCLIGRGASGLSAGSAATADDSRLIGELLATVGLVEIVPEPLLDAVTGLSGSGPAYVFQMIEALSDGGVKMGLPRATATRLAAQTLAGAAEMLLSTGLHPGALKDSVTSPGGTTIAGLHAMEVGGVRAALINAVEAATLRSRELGK
ncbi:MAG TPA: pyrroline-5-carboxylate reductase, partial [Planctomycetaceae bacterium]|nr:pyrroline-5-carboxylate reductase [Planctomycetaceae bacterium]